jgi:RNA polymerase sigma-70 factor (ECF subfamily)
MDHLFRREHGRMVATVSRVFGVHNLKLAEDVVQDAFCRALEVWKVRGLPENPSAWLVAAAKNRALDVIRRERTARRFAPDLDRELRSEWTLAPTVEEQFSANAIRDDLLRMMFSCCHPAIPADSTVALILNILCGFSGDEIAAGFMITEAAAAKRIARAKKVLARSGKLFEVNSPREFAARLPAVHRTLYLLFNAGYHGASAEAAVRAELCHEAIRLSRAVLEHPLGAIPESQAFCALLCLNAARISARLDSAGNLLSLFEQDRGRWDHSLIAQGLAFLEHSAAGSNVSEYHVQAAIAAVHARAPTVGATNWAEIVGLYDVLMQIRPSPVVALNRAIAICESAGASAGLEALRAIEGAERLAAYPFYPAAFGEFELRLGRNEVARNHFRTALDLARNPEEQHFLGRRLAACDH